MTTTSNNPDWNPKTQTSRFADTTANIHRTIAWIYGVVGFAIALFVGLGTREKGAAIAIALVVGVIVGVHAALAAGARSRNSVAQVGSVIVGVLMLAGFPVGTIVGGFLIYNGVQTWPPRRDPSMAPAGGVDMRL